MEGRGVGMLQGCGKAALCNFLASLYLLTSCLTTSRNLQAIFTTTYKVLLKSNDNDNLSLSIVIEEQRFQKYIRDEYCATVG